jgi:5'-methylthioadenosine phosphorylase
MESRPADDRFPPFVVGSAELLILLSALLPPAAVDELGTLILERKVITPYGVVGPVALRQLDEQTNIWIQPYTGEASRTDPRSTIFAAYALGVRRILAWDMVVALNPVLPRGQVGVVADYVDWTRQPGTFHGAPPAMPVTPEGHGSVLCPRLMRTLHRMLPFAVDVVYLGTDGPRRETPAEARLFRQWGVDVMGQNIVPEAALAREAGICFAGLTTVADFGADRGSPPPTGEVRASLSAVLSSLPDFAAFAATGTCDCAGPIAAH